MKRILAILLALVLTIGMSTSVFAAEPEDTIPANATRHTVEVSLAPGENIINPRIWGDPSMSLVDHYSAYTSSFYVSDKYFAFEVYGELINGTFTNEVFGIALEYTSGGGICSLSCYADGSTYKKDWITINVDSNYRFKVTNPTNYYLSVFITYYSWN